MSTAWSNTLVVLNSSCTDGDTGTCATSRGGTYAPNASSTFQNHGVFQLYTELNYTTPQDRAEWGLDTIGLGLDDSGPTLDSQVISGAETTDYYFGLLGIDPQSTNWTANFEQESLSFFKSLLAQKLIPSYTYGYTAGAPYRLKKVLGSLVFGGYDTSRVEINELTFPFAPDVSRDIVVGVQSIQSTTASGQTRELLVSGGVLAYIDSTAPYLVLPLDVCEAFEEAFGLEWNAEAGHDGLYTLTETQHNGLIAQNPNITFTLGNSATGGSSIQITLPYAAFDLTASYPLVSNSTPYFPLLRAANDSQITLGRTFLQETMLVADYQRGNFSVFQCVWDANAQQQIQTIHPIGYEGSQQVNSSIAQPQSNKGVPVGLGVGIGAGVPIFLALMLFFAPWKRVWPFRRSRPPIPSMGPGGPELDSKILPLAITRPESPKKDLVPVYEAPGKIDSHHRPELAGSQGDVSEKAELSAGLPREHHAPGKSELPGTSISRPGEPTGESNVSVTASEVEGSHTVMELPGSPVRHDYLHSSLPGSNMAGQ